MLNESRNRQRVPAGVSHGKQPTGCDILAKGFFRKSYFPEREIKRKTPKLNPRQGSHFMGQELLT
jgi:hypothetical protein